jgi:hypothetical protein
MTCSFFNFGARPQSWQGTHGMGGWAPGPVCKGTAHLVPTGIRPSYRPFCSESLYRLIHPGQKPAVVMEQDEEMR